MSHCFHFFLVLFLFNFILAATSQLWTQLLIGSQLLKVHWALQVQVLSLLYNTIILYKNDLTWIMIWYEKHLLYFRPLMVWYRVVQQQYLVHCRGRCPEQCSAGNEFSRCHNQIWRGGESEPPEQATFKDYIRDEGSTAEFLTFWLSDFLTFWLSDFLTFWLSDCWCADANYFLTFWICDFVTFWLLMLLTFWLMS